MIVSINLREIDDVNVGDLKPGMVLANFNEPALVVSVQTNDFKQKVIEFTFILDPEKAALVTHKSMLIMDRRMPLKCYHVN